MKFREVIPVKKVPPVQRSYISLLHARKRTPSEKGSVYTPHTLEHEHSDSLKREAQAAENLVVQHIEEDGVIEQDSNLAARLRKRLRDNKLEDEEKQKGMS